MPVEQKLKTAEVLAAPASIEEKVDRYGDLDAEVEKLEAQIENTRVKKLREEVAVCHKAQATLREEILKEATANLGDQNDTKVQGARFFAQVGKCSMRRAITDMKKAAELVGFDNFFELCTFPLGRVDDYLNPKERELVLKVDHDGARSFKVKPR